MRIGPRVLVGVMKEKDEARRIYTAARAAGERTALLEQKRPNVFQQSVANIQPGERIEIEIGYNEILDYVDGRFEFVFPMVVAPRYDPRSTAGEGAGAPHGAPIGTTYADMTTTAPQTRSGHDISVTVTIAAGNMHLDQLASRLHDVAIERPAPNMAVVRLKNRVDIPNRDFVLDYNIIGDEIGDALFTRDDPRHGRFFHGHPGAAQTRDAQGRRAARIVLRGRPKRLHAGLENGKASLPCAVHPELEPRRHVQPPELFQPHHALFPRFGRSHAGKRQRRPGYLDVCRPTAGPK